MSSWPNPSQVDGMGHLLVHGYCPDAPWNQFRGKSVGWNVWRRHVALGSVQNGYSKSWSSMATRESGFNCSKTTRCFHPGWVCGNRGRDCYLAILAKQSICGLTSNMNRFLRIVEYKQTRREPEFSSMLQCYNLTSCYCWFKFILKDFFRSRAKMRRSRNSYLYRNHVGKI